MREAYASSDLLLAQIVSWRQVMAFADSRAGVVGRAENDCTAVFTWIELVLLM